MQKMWKSFFLICCACGRRNDNFIRYCIVFNMSVFKQRKKLEHNEKVAKDLVDRYLPVYGI
jgi:hypothetical protein